MHTPELRSAIRGVAIFEASKGLAALLGLLGLLGLLRHDLHQLVLKWIDHVGLSPVQHYPALLLQAVDKLNATPVSTLVLLGSAYIALRWVEAWGLWQDKAWGEWLGALSCTIYLPLEVHHLWHRPSWQSALVLLVNIGLIVVMVLRLRQRRHSAPAVALPAV